MSKETFTQWVNRLQNETGDSHFYAVTRPPRPGETYDDGTPIKRPVNHKWIHAATGEERIVDE